MFRCSPGKPRLSRACDRNFVPGARGWLLLGSTVPLRGQESAEEPAGFGQLGSGAVSLWIVPAAGKAGGSVLELGIHRGSVRVFAYWKNEPGDSRIGLSGSGSRRIAVVEVHFRCSGGHA